jgi:ATP-dependent helicase IRC3
LAYPTKSIDIELGNSHGSGAADITVASVQSITSKDRIKKYDSSRFKLVLVDEAHHITTSQYLSVLEHFGLRPHRNRSPVLVGVSATFSRNDGVRLGTAFDYLAYHKDYLNMIEDGWLSDVLFTTVRLIKTDLSKVNVLSSGDFASGELSRAVNTLENNEALVAAWEERCKERKSTLVFCVDVQHVHDLARTFRKYGYESKFVTGTTANRERSETIDQFKRGEFPILLNCGVFTEGTDIPNIDCIVLARPTKSRNLLIQMIGRGMRLDSRKKNCHIIDMVSSLKTGIVTTPTLYGLDPDELVEEADAETLKSLLKRKEMKEELQDGDGDIRLKFIDYESVMDLVEETSGEGHVRTMTRNAWVEVGDDEYVLSTRIDGHIRVSREEDGGYFRVTLTRRLPPGRASSKTPFAKMRTIVECVDTLDEAIRAADNYAAKRFAHSLINRSEPWRSRPASEAQLAYLNKFRAEGEELTQDTLDKGTATDMMTKIIFGARGRFKTIEREKRQREREVELEQRVAEMSKDKVQVGRFATD